ncbi:hypothetical protein [Butyrivibrio sp. MC2013]|uniref:hypothetical protein n=1 Tax=Butyrivibrio sp. MC2013 TaxID=1280686 RepID=UPI0003FC62E6|nr:hypothetical protein [Butyrivibrio sp. MC2013]
MYQKMKHVDIDADEVEYLFEGKSIVNSAKAKVDRALLVANEKGVRIVNCAILSIDKDVEPELQLPFSSNTHGRKCWYRKP